ncbi:hypothetical protein Scep_009305 [Stephania cephalantha]|uniref:Uncharacterized protein n=1 Tax=Stephania cephalantha TaxID=152367 RepID=A0AAP0JTP1_9MAGN
MVPRVKFDDVAKQLRQVVAFMQRQFGITKDGVGLSQPPPPPPQEYQQAQKDTADPPQQLDNVDQETQYYVTGMSSLGILSVDYCVYVRFCFLRDVSAPKKLLEGVHVMEQVVLLLFSGF